ncbi:hypothetical protein R3P38DRAFT_3084859 [Favolaschia claudopus]|uniref:Secreted protein n=1 Tax=Favolaschia claudopus TaxID=2862362 RepID=A0AAV9ZUI2_9AGAR
MNCALGDALPLVTKPLLRIRRWGLCGVVFVSVSAPPTLGALLVGIIEVTCGKRAATPCGMTRTLFCFFHNSKVLAASATCARKPSINLPRFP